MRYGGQFVCPPKMTAVMITRVWCNWSGDKTANSICTPRKTINTETAHFRRPPIRESCQRSSLTPLVCTQKLITTRMSHTQKSTCMNVFQMLHFDLSYWLSVILMLLFSVLILEAWPSRALPSDTRDYVTARTHVHVHVWAESDFGILRRRSSDGCW